MSTQALSTPKPGERRQSTRTIHAMLGAQSVIVVLLSINRLSSLALGYVLPNEFLRWVDLNNMLVLPLASVVASYLLMRHMAARHDPERRESREGVVLSLGFLVGVYLLAASYGNHEVTNYLNSRFCIGQASSRLCEIVVFNDDEFSHWVFFTGFVMVNGVLMLWQVLFPHTGRVTGADHALLVFNGLFIALGIFANLGFEVIGLDLYVVALLAVLSLGLLRQRGAQPLLIYYATAYCVGLALTGAYKALG
jgi:hypothetical protein